MPDETSPLIKGECGGDIGRHTTTSNASYSGATQAEGALLKAPNQGNDSAGGLRIIIVVLIMGNFVANADGNFLITVYGQIASEFGRFSNAGWLLLMYPLATCATQTLYGKLSDIYGRKAAVLAAYVLFLIGLSICGIASSFWLLMIGRVVSGIGGGGIMPLTAIIITDVMPRRHVASWRSYANIAATSGRALGGPLGGLLADTMGWRWSFIIQCPGLLLAIVLVFWKLPITGRFGPQKTDVNRLKRIDFAGSFLLAGTLTNSLLALEAGLKYSWRTATTGSLAGTAVLFTILFVIIEFNHAAEPILPLRLFRRWNVVASYLIIFLQTFSQLAIVCLIPLYFQIVKNVSASISGLYLVPAIAGNCIAGVAAGTYVRVSGRYRFVTICGALSAVSGTGLMIWRWSAHTDVLESIYTVLCGAGYGIVLTTVYIAATIGIDSSDLAIAGAGFYQCLSIGWVSGVGITTALLQATLRPALAHDLAGVPGSQKIVERAISDVHFVPSLKGSVHTIVVDAYVRSIKYTYVLSLAFSSISLLLAFTLPEIDLEV